MAIAALPAGSVPLTIVPTGADALSLQKGQVLDARVVAALAGGAVRLDLSGILIDALARTALVPGQTLKVRVESEGGNIRLAVVAPDAPPRGAGGQGQPLQPAAPVPQGGATPPAGTGRPAPVAAREGARATPVPAEFQTAIPAPAASPAQARPRTVQASAPLGGAGRLDALSLPPSARQTAAPPPAGDGVVQRLFADLARAVAGPQGVAPEHLRQSAARLLGLTVPASGDGPETAAPAAGRLPQAHLFADLARVVAAERGAVPDFARAAAARLLGLKPATASGSEPAGAAPRQGAGGAWPGLLRAVSGIAANSDPGIPPAVREAAARLLAARLPVGAEPDAQRLQQAVQSSGLLYEAQLAGGNRAAAAGDLKLALFFLRDALRAWAGDGQRAGGPLQSSDGAEANATPRSAPVGNSGEHVRTADQARMLLAQTEAALARLRAVQVAALPDRVEQAPAHHGETPGGLNVVLPLAHGERSGVLEMQIDRDGSGGEGADGGVAWRVRFSLEIEPVGPAQALIALRSGAVAVSLWAERRATAELLQENEGVLRAMLEEAGLAATQILIRRGLPPAVYARGVRLLDRVS